MSVSYSTNWMGPVSIDWYKERGLVKPVKKVLEEDNKYTGHKAGEIIIINDITERYACGRIDIRGTAGAGEFIDDEYGLAPMKEEDWNSLTYWLQTVETDFVWTKEELLHNFENFIGRSIAWSENDKT